MNGPLWTASASIRGSDAEPGVALERLRIVDSSGGRFRTSKIPGPASVQQPSATKEAYGSQARWASALRAASTLITQGIGLVPFQPYIADQVNLSMASVLRLGKGVLTIDLSGNGPAKSAIKMTRWRISLPWGTLGSA
jgi:hypothetical protein